MTRDAHRSASFSPDDASSFKKLIPHSGFWLQQLKLNCNSAIACCRSGSRRRVKGDPK